MCCRHSRSAIFYAGEDERQAASSAIEHESLRLGRPVVTTLEPLHSLPFTSAEPYHQAYLAKGGQSDAKGTTAPIRCYG